MVKFTKEQQAESRQAIAKALANGAKDSGGRVIIYTVMLSVSKSGMTRHIKPIVIVDNVPVSLAWDYARSGGKLAAEYFGRWTVKVQGCGMDMGYHLAGHIAQLGADPTSPPENRKIIEFRHEWL